ncbi:ATP-binding protein [Konateibacter massiliensis]|uniref:ATP-binding protein n=1 Tax=Konateibacter massiliensis TaxID=2002841 RepID=UPI000C15149B|nr:ATP-binding protein [Konateibacter massiliensis]
MNEYWIYYFTYVGYVLELFAAELLFAWKFKRKSGCSKRIVGAFLVLSCITVAICNVLVQISPKTLGTHMLEEIIVYLLLLSMTMGALYICFNASWQQILLCAVTGYAVQHLESQISLILWYAADEQQQWVYWLGSKLVLVGSYWIIYTFIAKRANEVESLRIGNRNVLFLSVITILMVLVLSCGRDYFQNESFALCMITRLFSIMCCIFLLVIRGGFLEQSQLEYEVETIRQLNYKQRTQYEQNEQNIKLINIKCHDLKKRLEQYEDRIIGITPEEIEEMKQVISIYDTSVKTGNDILDTILTERSLICEKKGICFSCIADGGSLDFLSTGDLYALFANAVDNAMEAVSQLEDANDRIISLSVRKRLGLVAISIDNYYRKGKLEFEDGLPKTTKHNEIYHGYGMKSIQMIVQKYEGEMTIRADEMFHLAILLPIPQMGKG